IKSATSGMLVPVGRFTSSPARALKLPKIEKTRPWSFQTRTCFNVEAVTLRRPKSDRRQRRRLTQKFVREGRFVNVAEEMPDSIGRIVLEADFDGLVFGGFKIWIEAQLGDRTRRAEPLAVVAEEIQPFDWRNTDAGARAKETVVR